jgi:cytochrome oxidase Cu insertion factor (SCO1/SenC/PrrC family)
MGRSYVSNDNPIVTALFRHSVYVTSAYWIIGLATLLLLGVILLGRINNFNLSSAGLSEPRARTYLRLAFGAIWLFDGILQFQPQMPLGLANDVVQPTIAGAPSWLHPLMYSAIHLWNAHPVALATGTAWIQIGIGLTLIASNAGLGRLAAVVAAGWAALIWLIGNGAGGAFAPGNSILFGWPGATLFYFIAAVWIAVSPGFFKRWFSVVTLRVVAVLLAIAVVLQCLPSNEFWHGGNTNALAAMTRTMTQVAQPHGLAWLVRHVGDVAGTLGGGFNVVVILWLAVCSAGIYYASTHPVNWPVVTLAVGCVLFWVVGEDLAIFGGVGTDINSLIPLAVLTWCARPALRTATPVVRRLPEELRSSTGAVVAAFATSMVVFSIVAMGIASVSSAEPALFLAQNGSVSGVDARATTFTLTDQRDHPYTLGEHAGRYTLLTFLDPVCWTDCPLLAAQLKSVRLSLGASAKIDVVAVAANPDHQTLADVHHFIAIHDMGRVPNFYFLTGKAAATAVVWRAYGITVVNQPGIAMSIHSDFMFIINPSVRIRWIIPDDPLSGVSGQASTESELLSLLAKSGLH